MVDSFIALDIETTGLNPVTNSIIEIGAVKIREGIITDTFSELINPGVRLTAQITSLTGITDEMLEGKDDVTVVLEKFHDFSGGDIILGHNVIFDYSFIKVNMERMGISYQRMGLDTLKISRLLHRKLPSKSLENMCKYYKISNLHAHRAFDDAKAAFELYGKLKEEYLHTDLLGDLNDKSAVSMRIFAPEQLICKMKKTEPITMKQKNYLNDLIKYHRIEFARSISDMTKSEASQMIDKIILTHGKMQSR